MEQIVVRVREFVFRSFLGGGAAVVEGRLTRTKVGVEVVAGRRVGGGFEFFEIVKGGSGGAPIGGDSSMAVVVAAGSGIFDLLDW